ncbi:MAG TPA: alpha-ketoacid dehydrogenase subunit beta [Spirochaetia bacterium]|nr:alpha-ketoacid dehydrogenase subunit beta [Spirochaetia bacterium]
MKVLTLLEAVTDGLRTEMAADQSVVVFGQDVGVEGGVFRATAGLQRDFGESRCFDTPLQESGIVGAAIGMAVAGLKPVVEIQFTGFALSAFNQIANHAARIRNRTRGALTAPLVVRTPYGGGIRAPEHHSESTEALFGSVPGLKVVVPSTPHDAKGLLIAAIRDPDPVIFLEPARAYRAVRQQVPEESFAIQIGKAKVEAEGSELTLVSYGAQMIEARQARARLAAQGRSVELIDLRTIYPFDAETIIRSVRKTGRLLVVHEGPQSFGVASELIATVLDKAFESLLAPPCRLTGPDIIFPLPRAERFYLISADAIIAEAGKVLAYEP